MIGPSEYKFLDSEEAIVMLENITRRRICRLSTDQLCICSESDTQEDVVFCYIGKDKVIMRTFQKGSLPVPHFCQYRKELGTPSR